MSRPTLFVPLLAVFTAAGAARQGPPAPSPTQGAQRAGTDEGAKRYSEVITGEAVSDSGPFTRLGL